MLRLVSRTSSLAGPIWPPYVTIVLSSSPALRQFERLSEGDAAEDGRKEEALPGRCSENCHFHHRRATQDRSVQLARSPHVMAASSPQEDWPEGYQACTEDTQPHQGAQYISFIGTCPPHPTYIHKEVVLRWYCMTL